MPKLQSLFQHKPQHCFSICLNTVSAIVTAVFQPMFQHCFSKSSSTVFQHVIQHCFSTVSLFQHVPALCFSIWSSTVFQHMFQHCVSAYEQHCFSICSSTVSAYVPALCFSIWSNTVFQHMFQHCVLAYVPTILHTTIYNLLHVVVLFKGYRFLLVLRHLCIDLLVPGGSLYWLEHLLLCLSP
jgi:hypothetical protein